MTQPRKTTWPATLLKRNRREAPFDPGKIERVITAAGRTAGEFDPQRAQTLTERVVEHLPERACLDIERTQDLVERVLVKVGHYPTIHAYVVYRERCGRLRRKHRTLVDIAASMNEYLSREDWRVRANANQGYSLGGLVLSVSGKTIANYWLNEVYDADIAAAHRDADLHIHDLDTLADYCADWSLRALLNEDLNDVPRRVEAGPPKHLGNALRQMVNFLDTLQNERTGAQAFNSLDTYLAPYVHKDRLDHTSMRQVLQEFIYDLNVPSRWDTQTPFTNLAFDWVCPDDLRDQVPRIDGEGMLFAYGKLQAEMNLINHTYIEVMQAGNVHDRVFAFPISAYSITHDLPWDNDNATRLFEMTARYSLPYFQNSLNSDMQPNQVRSMCCRLRLDVRELLKRGNGLFGSAGQTGSLGVVTINCACLGYHRRGDAVGPYHQPNHLLELASASLELKHKVIQQHMDAGLYPYTRYYLGTLRNHFPTIGVNGLRGMVRNFSDDREGLHSEAGHGMALALLDHVRTQLVAFQGDSGHLYNLGATPAEGTTYRFARGDHKHYPRILQAGTSKAPYYTNPSQLPVGFTSNPFEALELQDALQCKYAGGTVLYLYMAKWISSTEACKALVRIAPGCFRLPYLTVTPTFSTCPWHGYLAGEHEFCPKCDEELLRRSAPGSCCGGCGG